MKIGELIDLKLYDENEQVVILSGEAEPPRRLYDGYLWRIPETLCALEIKEISAMSEYRRKQWKLNDYGWTMVWVEE